MKGAMREIRKDSYMIAQVQYKEQKEKYVFFIIRKIIKNCVQK